MLIGRITSGLPRFQAVGDYLPFNSRPCGSVSQPQLGHVQPPHSACFKEAGLRYCGSSAAQRGQVLRPAPAIIMAAMTPPIAPPMAPPAAGNPARSASAATAAMAAAMPSATNANLSMTSPCLNEIELLLLFSTGQARLQHIEWQDISRCQQALRSYTASLDHLVGEREQRRRNLETERLGGVRIDEKLDLGDLLNRQIGGLAALQDSPGIYAGLPVRFRGAAAIAQQPAGRDELARVEDRDHPMSDRQCSKPAASADVERIGSDHQSTGAQLGQLREGRVEIAVAPGLQEMKLEVESADRRARFRNDGAGIGIVRVDQQRNSARRGRQLSQELEALRADLDVQ